MRAPSRAHPLPSASSAESLKQLCFREQGPGHGRARLSSSKHAPRPPKVEFEEEEGLALSSSSREMAARVRGLHIMPMGRYGVVKRILEAL